MKVQLNAGHACNNQNVSKHKTGKKVPFFYLALLLPVLLFSSCGKFDVGDLFKHQHDDGDVVKMYKGLDKQTAWELEQARAATARYRDINNAIADGYENIHVDMQNMGHHYMKKSLVDATFDLKNPELLVYHENAKGDMELGAVEYAVPITEPQPEGFTGSGDVWDHNDGFQLWLLHAWVWTYNPDGVFDPMNPDVHIPQ
jgi:hypothetical protein